MRYVYGAKNERKIERFSEQSVIKLRTRKKPCWVWCRYPRRGDSHIPFRHKKSTSSFGRDTPRVFDHVIGWAAPLSTSSLWDHPWRRGKWDPHPLGSPTRRSRRRPRSPSCRRRRAGTQRSYRRWTWPSGMHLSWSPWRGLPCRHRWAAAWPWGGKP